MNHEQIEAIAAVLQESPALTEIELRGAGVSLRLRRARPKPQKSPVPRVLPPDVKEIEPPNSGVSSLVPVTAGVVGVFRVMGGAATVSVGDLVKTGQVLGQIEAIRLLNDCVSPTTGRVSLVAVQEGQPVEYGQLLFEISPE